MSTADLVVFEVPISAMQLQAPIDDLRAVVGGGQLGHCTIIGCSRVTRVQLAGRKPDGLTANVQRCCHLSQPELYRLIVSDGGAKLPPLLRVRDGIVQGLLCTTDAASSNVDSAAVET